ncbi:MAG: hypothetical protein GC160_23715 [Acidobacteria bacterium]|nr:hypothetical protein [Acidobacteriota bacterium]
MGFRIEGPVGYSSIAAWGRGRDRPDGPPLEEPSPRSAGGGSASNRWVGAALASCCAAAFALRALPAWGNVFQPDGVVFQGVDSWFHMRTAEHLAHNFPRRMSFDPYALIPGGQAVTTGPLLDYLIAFPAWLLGLGKPEPELVDTIGALAPAALGALFPLPVYWIGARLFGRTAGLLAAALIAILPGVFLSYSVLGLTDHHVTESLCYLLSLGCLLEASGADEPSRRARWTAGFGGALGLVLLNRPGAFFVVALFACWGALQTGADVSRGERSRWGRILLPGFALAALAFWPVRRLQWGDLALLTLAASVALVAVAEALSRLARRTARPAAAWWLGSAAAGAGLLALVRLAAPEQWAFVIRYGSGLFEEGSIQTVGELLPLFQLNGKFTWMAGFVQFTLGGVAAAFALAWLTGRTLREPEPARLLFVTASCVVLAFALAQNRNSVYLAPHVAILVGWVGSSLLGRVRGTARGFALAGLALAFYAPNLSYGIAGAELQRGPNEEWREALRRLRQATPEPFGDPEAYFAIFPHPADGEAYRHPPSAYGVLNWWDQGYWMEKMARRIPVSNGTQAGVRAVSRFYTETDPAVAAELLEELRARYVLVDSQLPLVRLEQFGAQNARFLGMMVWGERELKDYARVYFRPLPDGGRQPLLVYYPAYYQSMLARLFLFGGRAVDGDSAPTVISYREQQGQGGATFRTVVSQRRFDSYQAAVEYVSRRPDQPLEIVGLDPTRSCVPLEALSDYRSVYDSPSGAIRLFEYVAPTVAGAEPTH